MSQSRLKTLDSFLQQKALIAEAVTFLLERLTVTQKKIPKKPTSPSSRIYFPLLEEKAQSLENKIRGLNSVYEKMESECQSKIKKLSYDHEINTLKKAVVDVMEQLRSLHNQVKEADLNHVFAISKKRQTHKVPVKKLGWRM